MQMVAMGAAICMDQGMGCDWVEVIYAAAIATAWFNLAKKWWGRRACSPQAPRHIYGIFWEKLFWQVGFS